MPSHHKLTYAWRWSIGRPVRAALVAIVATVIVVAATGAVTARRTAGTAAEAAIAALAALEVAVTAAIGASICAGANETTNSQSSVRQRVCGLNKNNGRESHRYCNHDHHHLVRRRRRQRRDCDRSPVHRRRRQSCR